MDMLQPTADADHLIDRVARLLDDGRVRAARPLLAAARRAAPASPELSQLAARLALYDGSFDDAHHELDLAIAAKPGDPGLHKARAELRQRMGDLDGATRDAAEAVILGRHDPYAKALLGSLMLELGRPGEAAACLDEAVEQVPANPAFREALAAAQEACGETDAALATLDAGIAAVPVAMTLRNAAVMLCIRRRDFTGAVRHAEAARAAGIADACLFGLKGHALSSLGRHEEAAEAYQEALKLGPDDPYVRHLVAASGARPSDRRAPPDYVRTVFDGYAERFELHLVSLGYRIPGVIRRVLQRHPRIEAGVALGPVLDLGCGTGLVGLAIEDLPVGPMTGVDVSCRMLQHARVKQIYADLREADLMTMLTEDTAQWPLIVAADVLCYFGALEDVLRAVHDRLQPNGWFVFSLEELLPDHDGRLPGNGDWALLRQGRYAHSVTYASRAAMAAGFSIRTTDQEVVRFEADVPVQGMLMVLERTAAHV